MTWEKLRTKSLLQFATFGKFNERNMALSILAP